MVAFFENSDTRKPSRKDSNMEHNEIESLLKQRLDESRASIGRDLQDWLQQAWEAFDTRHALCFPAWADRSGELVVEKYLCPAKSAEDLMTRYTGDWDATYQSGYGKHWRTVGDEFDQVMNDSLHLYCGEAPEGVDDCDWSEFVFDYVFCETDWYSKTERDELAKFNDWLQKQSCVASVDWQREGL